MQTKITIRNEAQTCYIDIEGTIGVEGDQGAGKSSVATYEAFRREVERIKQVAAQHIETAAIRLAWRGYHASLNTPRQKRRRGLWPPQKNSVSNVKCAAFFHHADFVSVSADCAAASAAF